MIIISTVPPESGTDDARCADTEEAENDRKRALEAAQRNARDTPAPGIDTETQSLRLAREYLRLGGHRRAKIDDNIITVRHWEADPPEAEDFWRERVETLSRAERQQVEHYLPTINTP
ncbi:hypothetical protein NE852_29405 (plasmid) [Rhizobium sp. Pop5]|uniref:hypothetical protein n=1 Tax=Rhizobium sp. Pop5 TaxID=1223565 RepID=UPI000283607C|nr:hypothetical protein [Rhizobium sp. Pop5]EJZ18900.1 hypothetical protein RCCGEPOP_23102 [Rhizobium sp. Pop5]UVD60695.1 hypothetical protein NE852_29405 [Rhizobium sp. Pop5]